MSDGSEVYARAIGRIRDAIERASATGRRNMNAMSLATVDPAGAPSVRMVLLRSIDEAGLRLLTDGRRRSSSRERAAAAAPCARSRRHASGLCHPPGGER